MIKYLETFYLMAVIEYPLSQDFSNPALQPSYVICNQIKFGNALHSMHPWRVKMFINILRALRSPAEKKPV